VEQFETAPIGLGAARLLVALELSIWRTTNDAAAAYLNMDAVCLALQSFRFGVDNAPKLCGQCGGGGGGPKRGLYVGVSSAL
jgi:hypothetical protein